MKKSGWGENLLRVCGSTPKPYCAMGVGARLRIRGKCSGSPCVTEDFLWEHEWVTERNVFWKECDILEALN